MVQDRYNRGAIAFHWTIALLVIFNLIVGIFHESLLRGLPLMGAHKAVGVTVLFLSLARLAWRMAHPVPAVPEHLPAWERMTARVTHALFYVFMIVLPLSGWIMVSGPEHRRPLNWFGLFDIPYLSSSSATASAAGGVHEVLGFAWAALVVLHIAAALRHHYILRDRVMMRMMPGRG